MYIYIYIDIHMYIYIHIYIRTEEITARTAAAASTSKIISQLSISDVDQVNDYLEMFKRMSNEEAGEVFYTRVSSCFVIAELYRYIYVYKYTFICIYMYMYLYIYIYIYVYIGCYRRIRDPILEKSI
jgi:hypothetical protein